MTKTYTETFFEVCAVGCQRLILSELKMGEGTADVEVLAWAAAANRVLITNDRKTMVNFACQRGFAR